MKSIARAYMLVGLQVNFRKVAAHNNLALQAVDNVENYVQTRLRYPESRRRGLRAVNRPIRGPAGLLKFTLGAGVAVARDHFSKSALQLKPIKAHRSISTPPDISPYFLLFHFHFFPSVFVLYFLMEYVNSEV